MPTRSQEWSWGRVPIALAILATATLGALPGVGSATNAATEADMLARAQLIRAQVDARYRTVPGRRLAVTEATATGVVESLTLLTDLSEPSRSVSTENGIYFTICPARASCPYPARAAARRASAFVPRRMALELALRTFVETSASLVLVSLPTREPVWVVFERGDLLAAVDPSAALGALSGDPTASDASLRSLVDRLTTPLLFLPIPVLPLPRDTIYAVRLTRP